MDGNITVAKRYAQSDRFHKIVTRNNIYNVYNK